MTNLDSVLKGRDIILPTKICVVKAMVFPVVMYRCENLTIKRVECQRIDTFELWCWRRLLRVPWMARRSNQSINPKGNQPWIYIGRSIAESGAPILWPPDVKSWHIGKDPEAGKDWRQKEKVVAEDEMVRSHHRLSRHEFEWTLGDSGGQMSLACCNPWGCKELDMT